MPRPEPVPALAVGDAAFEARLLVDASASSRRAARRRQRNVLLSQLALAAVLLLLWQGASGRWIDPLFFSSPTSVVAALAKNIDDGTLWWHLQATLTEMVLGYALGVAAGVGAAVLVSLIPYGEPIVRPGALAAFATPKVALAPLIIIWFGIGLLPKVILAAALVFFVVYFNTLVGIGSASAGMMIVARVMGASHWGVFRKIVLPRALPSIVVAMRITLPASLIGAIIGEFVSSNRGIGYMISAASTRFDTATVFAGILSLLVFVLILNFGVSLLERNLLRWRGSERSSMM